VDSVSPHLKKLIQKSPEELVPVNLEMKPILPYHIESELVKYCTEVDARQIA
jgi:hypothetical protein